MIFQCDQLIGHERAIQQLQKAMAAGQCAQSLLITGPPQVGKQSVAQWLAASLMCLQPIETGACGECASCIRLANDQHPELHIIEPHTEQTLIWQLWEGHGPTRGVDAASAGIIERAISYSPTFGKRTVFIITRAESLTDSAANSLLKTLEEPPAYAVLILLATSPEDVIQTIRSRCALIPLSRVPVPDVVKWLIEKHQIAPEIAARCAEISQGCPGRALSISTDKEAMDLWNQAAELARDICMKTSVTPALALADRLRQMSMVQVAKKAPTVNRAALLSALDSVMVWLRDAMVCAATNGEGRVVFHGEEHHLMQAGTKLGASRLADMIEIGLELRRAIDGNANTKLATDLLMMRLLGCVRQS